MIPSTTHQDLQSLLATFVPPDHVWFLALIPTTLAQKKETEFSTNVGTLEGNKQLAGVLRVIANRLDPQS